MHSPVFVIGAAFSAVGMTKNATGGGEVHLVRRADEVTASDNHCLPICQFWSDSAAQCAVLLNRMFPLSLCKEHAVETDSRALCQHCIPLTITQDSNHHEG